MAKWTCLLLFLSPFTLCKMIVLISNSFVSPICSREAPLQDWIVQEEQQSGSLLMKCDLLSTSFSQGLIQLRLEQASESHMQIQSTQGPRKLLFCRNSKGKLLSNRARSEGGKSFYFLRDFHVWEINSCSHGAKETLLVVQIGLKWSSVSCSIAANSGNAVHLKYSKVIFLKCSQ